MSGHDELCDYWRTDFPCQCDLIDRVRTDERERTLNENGGNVILALEDKIATLEADLDHAWAVANGEARR